MPNLPLEKQVVNLELAKKLKELGVQQESLFWWLDRGGGFQLQYVEQMTDCAYDDEKVGSRFDWAINYMKKFGEDNFVSAFTVAELGEMLPKELFSPARDLNFIKNDDNWQYFYETLKGKEIKEIMEDKTEADARAKTLIYLLENGLINK